jgi:CcmD family protein
MIRVLSLVLVLMASAPAAPAFPQSEPTTQPSVVQAPAGGVDAIAPQATPSGLPVRPPAPRTLRDYWHLFIAYAVVWVLIFGYVISLGRRFGRVEAELQRARGG